ncbi:MAG: sigma-70 family RNA polymerase sigma factor [Polyangiaceae bacterium]
MKSRSFGKSGYNAGVSTALPPSRSGSGPSDAALVVAARANEAWAKEALFRRYATLVNGLAYRLLGRDSDLDDLVQDCYTEAWRSLARLENPQAFSSWLSAIVVRTAHKMIRRRRLSNLLGLRPKEAIDLDRLLSVAAPPDVQFELRAIYRLVDEMPPATRVAFILRRVEGMGLEEIATMMKLSLATVKRRVQEAERLLAFAYPKLDRSPRVERGPDLGRCDSGEGP